MDKIKKNIFEIKFYFFSSFWKITVGGFVNQLIKNSGLKKFNLGDTRLLYNELMHWKDDQM